MTLGAGHGQTWAKSVGTAGSMGLQEFVIFS